MDKQGYILRYYLPVKPNFDETFTEKRFEELLGFCKDTDVGAVMFYVALDPDFYYMPDTVEYAKTWREQMLPYIKKLKEQGISYQLNFQNLLGATTAGADFTKKYDWEPLVDYTGRKSACGCPIGKKFRENAGERLRIWAETDPDIIWIDDDLRLHGHGNPLHAELVGENGNYVDFYCFCDEHIRLFNERYNVAYDRETLVKEILQKGEPSWARKSYLEFLSDTMSETAKWVSSVVHTANSCTRVAQMTSTPDSHAAEGRNWGDFLTALGDGQTPVIRPTFGPYHEYDPRDFTSSYSLLSQIKAHVRETYKGKVDYCPEVENTRFTVWSKSASATSYQLALSAFMGCKDITLSLYDLEGGALFDEPAYGKMLKKQKPFLDKLVALELDAASELGVIIPTSGDSAKSYRCGDGASFARLRGEERYIHGRLLKMGIPCRFLTPSELNGKGVVALDAYTANFLSDDVLQKILKGAVFLDAGATQILLERGYSHFIGINKLEMQRVGVHAEIIKTFTRDDGTYIRIPSRIPPRSWYSATLEKEAQMLSEFRTPTGNAYPASIWFENAVGGKVAIYLAKNNFGDGFYTHHRVTFIKDIFARLSPELTRLDCRSYTLFAVEQKGEEKYYLLTNLSADTTDGFIIDGQPIDIRLKMYQTAVFVERQGKIELSGQTEEL